MFTKREFVIGFSVFIFLNIFFYLLLFSYNTLVPFNKDNYLKRSHHFFQDERIENGEFNFLRSLGAWDGQWYLRIALAGYPTKEDFDHPPQKYYMGALTYAFHPFYPLVIATVNRVIDDGELSAFLLNNLLLIANFFSLYYFLTKLHFSRIALKTTFLLLFYPFSLFFRAYYSEGLLLFLTIWFTYFLIKRKWAYVTTILYLLFATKSNSVFLLLPLGYALFTDIRAKKISLAKSSLIIIVPFIFMGFWYYFNYIQTGDPQFWIKAHHVWYNTPSIGYNIVSNIGVMLHFFNLPFHGFHASKLEILAFVAAIIILFKTKKTMKLEIWLTAFALSVLPVLAKDFTSYARYQIVAFPLFMYLGNVLKGVWYWVVMSLFYMLLVVTAIYFINWHWVQ